MIDFISAQLANGMTNVVNKNKEDPEKCLEELLSRLTVLIEDAINGGRYNTTISVEASTETITLLKKFLIRKGYGVDIIPVFGSFIVKVIWDTVSVDCSF